MPGERTRVRHDAQLRRIHRAGPDAHPALVREADRVWVAVGARDGCAPDARVRGASAAGMCPVGCDARDVGAGCRMKSVYLIGICGTAMASLAGLLRAKGYEVRG